MNSFIAAAYMVLNFGGWNNASAVQIPMPSLAVCEYQLHKIKQVNPRAIVYGMCIPAAENKPADVSKGLW